jgi:hypothetical protein
MRVPVPFLSSSLPDWRLLEPMRAEGEWLAFQGPIADGLAIRSRQRLVAA